MPKGTLLIIVLAAALAACDSGQPAPAQAPPAAVVPAKPTIDHYYALHDGYDYGYEPAVSTEDANKGQVASGLLMVRYAGMRGGKYQAYVKEGSAITAIECGNPCDFLKVMTFYDGEHVRTERMRAVEGAMGWLVMADAINGKLSPWIGVKNGQKVNVWFDEKGGIQQIPISSP